MPPNKGVPPGYPEYASNQMAYEMHKYSDFEGKSPKDFSDQLNGRLLHGYAACVSYIDAQIGLILDELKNQGLSNNTTVVLTSDHGFSLSEHGRWTKHNLFQYELKIPMIISSPKYKKNKISQSFVELVDLYATFCDLAGLETPDFVQGKSLIEAVDLMRGPVCSEIELTVRRQGEKKALTFYIVREVIQIQSVKADLLDKNIGYIRLTSFN